MSVTNDQDERALDRMIREAFARTPPLEPPADFADVVLARRRTAPARRPRRWRWPLAAAAVAAVLLAASLSLVPPAAVSLQAAQRQAVALHGRGTAVLEAGSALRSLGRDRWGQDAGSVFYRVDRGGAFSVATPAGDVVVLGTCFRVEVDPMKLIPQTKIGFVAGAVLSAAVVVTVYEGRVRLASGSGQVELDAGEQGHLLTGQAPRKIEPVARPPALLRPADSEVATLRAQVAAQDKELATLRQQRSPAPKGPADRYTDVSHEELLARAARCEVKWDLPDINGYEPNLVSNGWAREAALSDTERDAVNEAIKEVHTTVAAELRKLFVESGGGDPQMADKLPNGGLMGLMMMKASDEVRMLARDRLSKERAGLQAPPPDLSRLPPVERAIRLMTGLGDEMEKKVADRLGPDRARTLRRLKDGWPGGRQAMSGCPEGPPAR